MNTAVRALEKLPLDIRTLELLERKLTKKSLPGFPELAQQFAADGNLKSLESIVHLTYFHWCNEAAPHIKKFREHYVELRDHWPYEFHRSILSMDSPKSQSIRFLWSSNSPKVLSKMSYERYMGRAEEGPRKLTELQRTVQFHEIFQHFLFLKSKPYLCKTRKGLAIPIVEIPMKPLGQNIPEVRVRNLFKRKIAYVWRILALDNPALSIPNERSLTEIIDSPRLPGGASSGRELRRLYQRACRGAYTINQHPVLGLEIKESELLKRL
ncbi:LAQU0S25e00914g1_1 [Lachancea quebecensis]|uniref:Genetic interactor of prohibitin 5, mitochondrial n=1 Tax=Lachancea quebecensis TaxID=1654605 RepID=A0A0P1KXT8_9SACH|nr:LAQU0S25e00914g1_1 [Lachancea quebecensis]